MSADPEALHRALLETTLIAQAPVGIFLTDAQGQCLFVNDRWCAMAGMTAGEALGGGWVRALHPEDRERVAGEWYAAAEAGREFASEYRFQTPAGQVTWLRGSAAAVRSPSGEVTQYLGTVTDITEAKRAEQALRESETLYRTLGEAVPDFIWACGSEGEPLFVNQRWTEYTGLTRDDAGGLPMDVLHHPEDYPHLVEIWEAARRRAEPYEAEFRFRRHDGIYRWFMTRAVPVKDEEGRILQWVGTTTDIHERKQGEALLRRQSRLLEQTSDAVFVWDLGGSILFWNRAAEALYGYTHAEATGHRSHDLLATIYPMGLANTESILAQAGHWEGELTHTTRDGRQIVVESRQVLVEEADGQRLVLETNRDITDRKRAEAALSAERERLLVTLSSIGDAVIVTDADGRPTFLNPVAEALTGWTQSEARGRPLEDVFRIVNEETRRAVESPVSRVLREGMIVGLANHTVLLARDGSERGIDDSAAPIFDAQGAVIGVVLVFRDVTERRRAEETRMRLAAIVESSDVAIFSKDMAGLVTSWNRAAERLYGYSAEEMVGEPITRILPPERADEFPALMERLRRGERIEQYETVRVRKDGERLDVMINLSPVRSHSGQVTGAAVVARDVTEEKRLRREQSFLVQRHREIAARLGLALSAARLGDWSWDAAAHRVTLSESAAEIFGIPADPPMSWAQMRELLHEEDRERAQLAVDRALAERSDYDTEYRVSRPEGGWRWVSAKGRGVYAPDGAVQGMIGVVQDITERKNLEAQLRERAAELLAADRRKDDFLAMLAHELRNPLGPIRNALHLLHLQAGDPAAVDRWRTVMERQVGHMTRLVDDLLDVSRINRGKISLRPERLDLRRLIELSVTDHHRAMEEGGLSFEVRLPETPVWVMGDATRLTQVLDNLLDNARKFTPAGGKVGVGCWAGIREAGGGVGADPADPTDPSQHRTPNTEHQTPSTMVTVTDTGIGIEPEMLPRLFEVFSQSDRSLDRSRGGMGLGLALVKGLIELHHGRVEARSAGAGHGAEFVLRLPLEPEPRVLTERREAAVAPAGGRRILVIEDNRDAAETLQELLQSYGHRVSVAFDGPRGLEAAEAEPPEVIVCDIGLPGMDGYQVAQELRQRPRFAATRLIALTGYGQEADVERSQRAGFDVHLTKPVDPSQLLNRLKAD